MSSPSPSSYKFGPFRVSPRTRELFKFDRRLKLRPQPFSVLELLLARPGELVTRQELKTLLWPEETFVDFERGLNTAIKELRGALSDSASDPRYIETLPKLGYRFIGTIESQPLPAAPTAEEIPAVSSFETKIPPAAAAAVPDSRFGRHAAMYLAAGLLVALSLFGLLRWQQNRKRTEPTSARRMLAVLPFENLTGDPSQDYFSDGFTEEMIGQLGRVDPQHLGVIARSSVMQYKKDRPPLDKIGHDLGVQYVLTGAVRREDNQVRISAQLIQLQDNSNIWSREYDRELSHFLTLQSDLAQEIANGIHATFRDTPGVVYGRENPRSPKNYEAYDLYLKGMYFTNKRTGPDFQRSIEYFEQSIAKDPDYAPAYSALANAYVLSSGYAGTSPQNLMSKAHATALRAVALDDSLAEVHTSLAVVAQDFDWDWATAEKEYRRAIQLNPNYATAHQWYGEYLALMGRFDEAFAQIQLAKQLDPLSLIITTDNGDILYYARKYDQAIEQFQKVLDMEPYFGKAGDICMVYTAQRNYGQALAVLEHFRPMSSDGPWFWAQDSYINGSAGKTAEAHRAFERLRQLDRVHKVDPLVFTVASIGINDKEGALAYLEKAYEARSVSITSLKVRPTFDPLRDDPRFQNLLRRMNLSN